MTFKKKLKILFFINGSSPTSDDELAAMELDGAVCFRNAEFAGLPEQGIEDCDGVAGDYVPKAYANKFPTAINAIAKNKELLLAMRKKTGDELPPKIDEEVDEDTESKKPSKQAWGGKK